MASGDFSCADLQTVLVTMDRVWANQQVNKDYVSYAESLRAIITEQTASFEALQSSEKDNKVKVFWIKDCDETISDCGNDCVVGGSTPEADCKEYELDICKTTGFSVPEKRFRTSNLTREEVVARALLRRLKTMDEYLAKAVVAKLNAFAGVNQFSTSIGSVVGTTTYIAPALWTADIAGYFAQVAIMNKLSNPFVLNGTNLWQQNWQAQFNNLNQDQKDALAKLGSIRMYWDPFNVDTVNSPAKRSYLIDKGSVAFVNKAYYPLNNPVEYIGAGQTRYSIESRSIPGVFYDVVYTNECVNNEIIHHWSLYVKAGIFLNPLGCNDEVTGVLMFECGAPPAP